MSGLAGRNGANRGGGPPPSAGRQDPALALHQEPGKGHSGKPGRFSILSVPEISAAQFRTQTSCILETVKISNFWVCYTF